MCVFCVLLQSLLTDRGSRMSKQVTQLYSAFEHVISFVSPLHGSRTSAKTRTTTHTTATACNKDTTVNNNTLSDESQLEEDLLDTTLVDESVSPKSVLQGAAVGSEKWDLSLDISQVSLLESLPADFSLDSTSLLDATIEGIQVLELPPALSSCKSVDSKGKIRERPVSFSQIRKIDKCSTNKWSTMHSPRGLRHSPFPRGRAKRRLSDEFEQKSSNSKNKDAHIINAKGSGDIRDKCVMALPESASLRKPDNVSTEVISQHTAMGKRDAQKGKSRAGNIKEKGVITAKKVDSILGGEDTDTWYVT